MSPDTLRIIFSLLCISTILFVYEVTLFYKSVTPNVSGQINNSLKTIGLLSRDALNIKKVKEKQEKTNEDALKQVEQSIQSEIEKNEVAKSGLDDYNKGNEMMKIIQELPKHIHNVFEINNIREERLNNKINKYTEYTSIIILLLLVFLLLVIKGKLNAKGNSIGMCTWLNISASLSFIFAFQYVFYNFGMTYGYLGSEGNEELIAYLLQSV